MNHRDERNARYIKGACAQTAASCRTQPGVRAALAATKAT